MVCVLSMYTICNTFCNPFCVVSDGYLVVKEILEGGAQLSGIAQKLANNKKSTIFIQSSSSQYAKQESNEVERYSQTKITAPFYDP